MCTAWQREQVYVSAAAEEHLNLALPQKSPICHNTIIIYVLLLLVY